MNKLLLHLDHFFPPFVNLELILVNKRMFNQCKQVFLLYVDIISMTSKTKRKKVKQKSCSQISKRAKRV